MTDRWTRLAPLTGVIAVVLAVVAVMIFAGGDPPDSDAPADEVVAFYTDEDSSQIATSILSAYAALFLVFFAGALRVALRRGSHIGWRGTRTWRSRSIDLVAHDAPVIADTTVLDPGTVRLRMMPGALPIAAPRA